MTPEAQLALRLAVVGNEEQAREACRIALQHGATPAAIATVLAAWEVLHDETVVRIYTGGAA